MKKIYILTLAFALFFSACSEGNVKKMSTSKKEALITKVFSGDLKAKTEFEEITNKIIEQSNSGNEVAKKEREEWEGLFFSKLFSGNFKFYYEDLKKKKEEKK